MRIRQHPDLAQIRQDGQMLIPDFPRMGWLRYLPNFALTVVLSVAETATLSLSGAAMWENIEQTYAQSERAEVEYLKTAGDDELAEGKARDEKLVALYEAPVPSDARGMVSLLINLGIVVSGQSEGEEVLDFADTIPFPEERLPLPAEEVALLVRMRADEPLEMASSELISYFRHARIREINTSLNELNSLTSHPIALLRQTLRYMVKAGEIRLSRPLQKLEPATRFTITPQWSTVEQTRVMLNPDAFPA